MYRLRTHRRLWEKQILNIETNTSGDRKMMVWWDTENCGVPKGFDGLKVYEAIVSDFSIKDLNGLVEITALTDAGRLPLDLLDS